MKRPKIVRVVKAPLPRAGSDIEGIRRKDDVLPVGSIVPVEWFQECSDAVFTHYINPDTHPDPELAGLGIIEAYSPDTKEMVLLRDQYPDLFAEPEPQKVTRSTKKQKNEEGE